jgi:hypothetical protein
MNRRRAVIGLSLLCAFLFSAVMAPNAFGVEETVAFTCVKKAEVGGVGFSKEHCRGADAVPKGAVYEHKEIEPGASTLVEATNKQTTDDTTGSTMAVLHVPVST